MTDPIADWLAADRALKARLCGTAPKPKSKRETKKMMKRRTTPKVTPKPTRRPPTIRAIDDPVPPELREPMTPSEALRASRPDPDQLRPATQTDARDVLTFTPCSTCGGGVAPQPWRWREHEGCSRLSQHGARVRAAAVALGLGDVGEDVAALVRVPVQRFRDVHPEPTWTTGDRKRSRQPWQHIDRKALRRAIAEAQTEREEALIPRPCEWGRCAWCGVDDSLSWHDHGHVFTDGSPAALCGPCSTVYVRRGSPTPTYPADARAALGEALSGVPASMGVDGPVGLLALHEVRADAGTGEPWSHLPTEAVEAFRWAEWGKFGGKYAPPEHRAEARRRAQQADAERAARSAEAHAEEERAADRFGFTGASR